MNIGRFSMADDCRRMVLLAALGLVFALGPVARLAAGTGETGAVNSYFGSFTSEVPIAIPSFRGLEPNLSLAYNSGSRDSWLGVGWSLTGLSFIERSRPGGGAPRYDSGDAYFMDGVELVPYTGLGGTHAAKIQNYARIKWESANNRWLVWGTNGNLASYQAVYGTASGTYRWMLKTVVDPRGNTVTYNYWCDPGKDCYLDNIAYNGATIKFYRELRPDPITFGTGAGLGEMRYRLRTIQVKVGSQTARAYKLNYAVSAVSSRSLLASVQQYGRDAVIDAAGAITSGSALPAMTLAYHAPPRAFASSTWTGSNAWGGAGYTWAADFNGDGKTDMASANGGSVYMKLATASGFTQQTWTVPSQWGGSGYTWVGDFNGDGKADIASANGGSVYMRLSTGSGFQSATWTTTSSWGDAGYTWTGDFNGDDKTDIASANGGSVYMRLSTGSGFTTQTWSVASLWGGSGYTWVGDFNGDGRTDIASAKSGSVYMKLSTGSGFTSQTWTVPNSWGGEGHTWVGDFNGDGLSDIGSANGGSIYMKLSTGTAFTTQTWTTHSTWGGAGYTWASDFNGDRKTDIASAVGGNVYLRLSKGTGFTAETWTVPNQWGGDSFCRVGDFNGDGRSDLASPNGASIYKRYSSGPPTDLMATVNNGIGGSTTVTYTPSSAWANTYLPLGLVLQTVGSTTVSDGRGYASTTGYDYQGGLWSPSERRFLGFRRVTAAVDSLGNYTETYYRQEVGSISKPETTYFRNSSGQIYSYTSYS